MLGVNCDPAGQSSLNTLDLIRAQWVRCPLWLDQDITVHTVRLYLVERLDGQC